MELYPAEDSDRVGPVAEVRQTTAFRAWLKGLRDRIARARILVRIDRLQIGLPGDARPVGHGVSELRIDYGPGYRVYFVRRGKKLVILLAGGDKRTQSRDIQKAIAMAEEMRGRAHDDD